MIILHFHPQPQFKNELFHIYFTSDCLQSPNFPQDRPERTLQATILTEPSLKMKEMTIYST